MGSRGMFLAPWTLDVNPKSKIIATLVWVSLPRQPLHLWGKSYLMGIGNKLGQFLDNFDPKGGQYSCVCVCLEFNIEKDRLKC